MNHAQKLQFERIVQIPSVVDIIFIQAFASMRAKKQERESGHPLLRHRRQHLRPQSHSPYPAESPSQFVEASSNYRNASSCTTPTGHTLHWTRLDTTCTTPTGHTLHWTLSVQSCLVQSIGGRTSQTCPSPALVQNKLPEPPIHHPARK